MKKVICIVLAIVFCLSTAVMANATPSKTVSDMYYVFDDSPIPMGVGWSLKLVPTEDDETAASELEKLIAAESVEAYFGDVKDSDGNAVSLKALLGLDTLNVYEFYRLTASEEGAPTDTINVKLTFPTQYEEGEHVIVLLGIVTDEQNVEWIAQEAVATNVSDGTVEGEGGIVVEFEPEMIRTIIEGTVLFAVASK